ncbi:MAG: type II secretion system protein C [Myxococcota bacterium]|jgi:type II secretion system protein C
MSTAPQRWTLAGLFLGVGLTGWLGAMATSRVAAGYLTLPEGATVADVEAGEVAENTADGPRRDRPGRSGRRSSKRSYIDAIVERSIFDSSKVGQKDDGPVDTTGGQKTDLKVTLLATIVSDPTDYSSALISGDKGAAGYGINDELMGEAVIVAIEPRKVVIKRNDGSIEYIEMGKDERPTARPARAGRAAAADEESGVEALGDNKFVVDASTLEQIMENPEQLYSQIRVVPHKDSNGEVDGYRLSGIRRKSFFYQLGVKNGDIVHSVNGKPLTSASSGMDAYNSLADAKDFTFELTRRNQKQTFEYEVR